MGNVYLDQKAIEVIKKWRTRLDAGDLMTEGQIVRHLDRLADGKKPERGSLLDNQ